MVLGEGVQQLEGGGGDGSFQEEAAVMMVVLLEGVDWYRREQLQREMMTSSKHMTRSFYVTAKQVCLLHLRLFLMLLPWPLAAF